MVQRTRADRLSRVAVVGTGAIGGAVAAALLSGGRRVTVWNRSPGRAAALVDRGAMHASDVTAAAATSSLVLVCLTDYPAAEQALAPLRHLDPAAPTSVVMLTTGTVREAEQMHGLVTGWGLDYLDAGVQTAPEDIGTDRATFIYSGSLEAFDAHRPSLELLGPALWLGTDPGAAARWDLALFGLWYDAYLGLLRAFEPLSQDRPALDGFAVAAQRQLQHAVDAVGETAAQVASGVHPRGPASLEEHLRVMRDLRDARARSRLGEGGLDSPTRVVEELCRRGHGALGLTAVLDHALWQ